MTSTITTATRIFLGMPDYKRKAIVNQIINVQGCKSPRTKADKDQDKVRGTNNPFRGEQNLKPIIFEQAVREFINR